MTIRSILVPLTGGDNDRASLDAAAGFARRFEAHVDALHIRQAGDAALPFMGEAVSGQMIEEIMDRIEAEATARAEKAKATFDAWREAHGLTERASPLGTGAGCAFIDVTGGRDQMLAVHARCADVTVFHGPSIRESAGLSADLETVLMSSGRPILITPSEMSPEAGNKVVVAWNDSAEAARAVTATMPVMRNAEAIAVVAVTEGEEGGPDLAPVERYFAAHSITAKGETVDAGDGEISDALIERTRSDAGGLLVMGAYTHSRVKEQVFGGVTQDILDFAEIPVLLVH